MKLKTLMICAVAVAALSSCDSVKDDERFIELPALEGTERVVLLEEYTGQKCVNCPEAHAVVEQLQAKYGDNLITVSLHGGGDANSISSDNKVLNGLRTQQSEAYVSENNIPSFPAGIVNRTSGVQTKDQWETTIREELKKESFFTIDIEPSYQDGQLQINLAIAAQTTTQAYVQAWVVESGIIGFQLSKDGANTQYVHNHVFRADVNGHGGELVDFAMRRVESLSYTVPLSEDWVKDNLDIVAFIYNKDGVLQAARCHVTQHTTFSDK